MEKINLQPLRDLPIEEVAQRLGLQVCRHKALCPFHDDHHPSLSFNTHRNSYRCFVCGNHGGNIDLAMHILHTDFINACRFLDSSCFISQHNITTSQQHNNHHTQQHNTTNQQINKLTRYAPFFEHPHLSPEAQQFLFSQRKLDPRVIRWCRLSSWKDRNGIPWLQIPYFDTQGQLIGIQFRNLNPNALPRFRFPQGSVSSIYNLPILNRLHQHDDLWITEGASDCWAMLSAGHKAIAIPSATLLKPDDIKTLQQLSSQLLIQFRMAPDNDNPGLQLFRNLKQQLPNLIQHQLPPECKDFSDFYLLNIIPSNNKNNKKTTHYEQFQH